MLIAFLVKDADDWADWKNRIAEVPTKLPIKKTFCRVVETNSGDRLEN
jgi:hypothetical protein